MSATPPIKIDSEKRRQQNAGDLDSRTGRPPVDVSSDAPLFEQVDGAWQALVRANTDDEPRVLVRGNELVRMTERGELEAFGSDSLKDELSRVADFGYQTKEGWKSVKPPADVVKSLLARDSEEYAGGPRVDRVVDVPVLAPDGSLISRPGHHADSRIYYRPIEALRGTDFSEAEPTMVDEVAEARELLMDDLLGDFGFADDASKANALALLLLPFVREYIGDAPTPMHVILAPEPGTGKTLLAQAALHPSCGVVPVTAGDRNHNDEWRKSLTALLLTGTRAIVLDNLSGGIDSGPLASALTTGVWNDRVLGYSKQVTLPVRNAWVATGNNLDLSDEQARRAVPIFLDPGEVRPADRPKSAYRHPDLMRWVDENRPRLVEAALTLVRHWLAGSAEVLPGGHEFYRGEDGATQATEATLGSFERWADVVGGVLAAAGVEGFLGNRDRLYAEANEESRQAAQFLEALYGYAGAEPLEFKEVFRLCAFGGPLVDDLPDELAEFPDKQLRTHLSSWLQQHNRRRIGGYQLLKKEGAGHRGRARWTVRKP